MRRVQKTQTTWLKQLRELPYATPFQVVDLEEARKNARHLKQLLPRVELYFGIKSNNDRRLIRAVEPLLDGFEVASLNEFKVLRSLGIASSRILFSNPVKIPAHIRQTYRAGLRHYAFDSLMEIDKLASLAPDAGVNLRLQVSDNDSLFPLSAKFGARPEDALMYAHKALLSGLRLEGVTFHVGSQSERPGTWTAAIKQAGELISALAKEGIRIELLNIGGGFPADSYDARSKLVPVTLAINQALERYVPPSVRVIAEPGRAIAASTSVLVTSVIGRETRNGDQEWLFLDMGVFQGLIEPLESSAWRYPVFAGRRGSAHDAVPFVLTGPTCDAYDTIGAAYHLPAGMRLGDRVYIGAAGAYTTVYGSSFNGFVPPRVCYINS